MVDSVEVEKIGEYVEGICQPDQLAEQLCSFDGLSGGLTIAPSNHIRNLELLKVCQDTGF